MFLNLVKNKIADKKKLFVLLIDPDKFNKDSFKTLTERLSPINPDIILVGGSLIFGDLEQTIIDIKEISSVPVYIFPGSSMQVSQSADGILFTSLISGRNPEFLIGHQVNSAPLIKQYNIDTVATGYMLIESNNNTAVRYMSNTNPIPRKKTDIALATALAGEMLGLKAIYLEAGSGAEDTVPPEMISKIKENISIPLIVGGGIKTTESITEVYNAGADILVIGNAFENDSMDIDDFKTVMNSFI